MNCPNTLTVLTLRWRIFPQDIKMGQEGRKEMFYLTTHLTHFIYGYMASDIWLRIILIVRKETRCRHHPTDKIAHTTAFVTPVVEHWLEWEIAQWVHPMKDRSDNPSHHERTLLPRSYISLQNGSEAQKGYSLVIKLMNSDTHSWTHSLASLAIWKLKHQQLSKHSFHLYMHLLIICHRDSSQPMVKYS